MYYIKKAIIGLVYLLFSAVTAYGIMFIPADFAWAKVVLLVLNLILYSYVLSATAFQDGQAAYKVRMTNDLNRKQIVLTGEDIPLDTKKEFRAYKGFIVGFVICVPLIILLIVHAVTTINTPKNQDFGITSSFIYLAFYAFAGVGVKVDYLFATVSPYWSLIAIPIIVAVQGVFYYLGGRKIELQQQMIKEKHKMLHGE